MPLAPDTHLSVTPPECMTSLTHRPKSIKALCFGHFFVLCYCENPHINLINHFWFSLVDQLYIFGFLDPAKSSQN
jgi:hypothetical protein